MTELDDLPQMVSLSPEPATTLDDGNRFAKRMTRSHSEFKRHNWDAQAIEVLWKQDCDLGLTRRDFAPVRSSSEEESDDVPEKLARLGQEWHQEGCKLEGPATEAAGDPLEDIWSGLDYTIDSETGEYVLRMPQPASLVAVPVAPATATAVPSSVESLNSSVGPLLAAPIPTTIDDLVAVDRQTPLLMPTEEPECRARRPTHSSDSGRESLCDSDSGDAELGPLSQVIGATHTPARGLQRPFQRLVSMEERWQDLASILLLSEQAGAQGALIGDQPPPLPLTAEYSEETGHCLTDTALVPATVVPAATPGLSVETRLPSPADMGTQYFQLAPLVSPPSPPALDQDAAFLSQLLGVDDLDMTEEPLEPQEWANTANSGGARSPVEHVSSPASQLHQLGSLAASSSSTSTGPADGARSHRPPAAQKKHHMYGKRVFNGQQQDDYNSASPGGSSSSSRSSDHQPTPTSAAGERYGSEAGARGIYPGAHVPAPGEAAAVASPVEFKYSVTAEFAASAVQQQCVSPVAHNHSYHQPSATEGRTEPRPPLARDKEARKGDRLSRDEKRTREMDIPMTPEEIVHLPMDEFNERLAKLQLSEAQLSLVRDVRRRGKNKLAAQNCRKRKLDQIQTLTDDLVKVRDQRRQHLADHQMLMEERSRIKEKYAQLHRHVFQSLRDERGQAYSAAQYSLQLSADGDVLLVPRGAARSAAFVPPDPSSGVRQKQQCD